MLDRFKAFWQGVMLAPFINLFIRLGISPDVVTIVGTLGVSAGALVFFPQGMLWQGVLVIAAFVFSDLIDGAMARKMQRKDDFGAFLDSTLDRVADGWCLVAASGQEWVVPWAAIGALEGASDRAVPEVAWSPLTRLGLASALRRLADAGEPCVLRRTDGGAHVGVLRRVGRDFVEISEGEAPRERLGLVAFASLAAVQSR